MFNKHNTFIIGLTSFTFFTGCIAFTTVTDQNKDYAKSQLNDTSVATPYLPAGQSNSLPPAASDTVSINVPVAASQPPKPQSAATIAPILPQPIPQPPVATSFSPVAQSAPSAPAATPKSKTTKTRAS